MPRFEATEHQVFYCSFDTLLIYDVSHGYVKDCAFFFLGDAYHITKPHTDGRGAILSMSRALRQVFLGLKTRQKLYALHLIVT